MNLLEALLLFLSLTWLLMDPEHCQAVTPPEAGHQEDGVQRCDDAVEPIQRAEQRLQQLTDQAVLAMVAELRRQQGNDW
ncbi:MAG TPA: hypothetical protein VK988_18560 [Acidimicrobiales bacterium]|nr:hypothetical protein [Acidimicrobiales bacterium]